MSDQRISALRAVAHPVRLRILSMLTAEAMSAAEVARALDIAHASASYHLRVLHDAGELVIEGEERIRGGVAKRYRYHPGGEPQRPTGPQSREEMTAWQTATHTEIVRRLAHLGDGPRAGSDIETWVDPEIWREYVTEIADAMVRLHESARPAGTPGTIHVSASSLAFGMDEDR